MKNLILDFLKIGNAKINLVLILLLLFSVGIGCKWNLGDTPTTDEDKVEKTDEDEKDEDEKKKPEKPDASTGEVPSDEQLIVLADESMQDFRRAVSDGDFSDFYDTLAEPWQDETSPRKLEKGFDVFIKTPIDVKKIDGMEPEITGKPRVRRELGYKMLNIDGEYDTSPRAVKFELKYIPEGKDWKLSAIRVNTKD